MVYAGYHGTAQRGQMRMQEEILDLKEELVYEEEEQGKKQCWDGCLKITFFVWCGLLWFGLILVLTREGFITPMSDFMSWVLIVILPAVLTIIFIDSVGHTCRGCGKASNGPDCCAACCSAAICL